MADVKRKLIASVLALVLVAAVLVAGCKQKSASQPKEEKTTKKAPVEDL